VSLNPTRPAHDFGRQRMPSQGVLFGAVFPATARALPSTVCNSIPAVGLGAPRHIKLVIMVFGPIGFPFSSLSLSADAQKDSGDLVHCRTYHSKFFSSYNYRRNTPLSLLTSSRRSAGIRFLIRRQCRIRGPSLFSGTNE